MAPPEPGPLVVCDAGPLIHLDELGCLQLLADFSEVCVPEAVWQEVKRHRPSALRHRSVPLSRVDIIPEPTPELELLLRSYGLHPGESEALRLMHQFPDATLLSDDLAVRSAAIKLGFEVAGTIGIVLRALRRKQRTRLQVLKLLRSIPQRSTLRIKATSLHAVIAQVQERLP
jgi:predicted nucleic acid-binding protein